ncbi:MAG: hypothetical protein AAFU64_08815 [Bacteroidota bacterium]
MNRSSSEIIDFSLDFYANDTHQGLREHIFENWARVLDSPHNLQQKIKSQIKTSFDCGLTEVHILNSWAEGYHQVLNLFRNSVVIIDLPNHPN